MMECVELLKTFKVKLSPPLSGEYDYYLLLLVFQAASVNDNRKSLVVHPRLSWTKLKQGVVFKHQPSVEDDEKLPDLFRPRPTNITPSKRSFFGRT